METMDVKNTPTETAKSIENKYRVNHVDSGLPRWLIESAFVCMLVQALINWTPLLHWFESNMPWAQAVISTYGELVMFVALMRGMRSLYHPFTVWWWCIIALNVMGFIAFLLPQFEEVFGLPVAVSLLLVYLPLGMLLWVFYRGRLRQVGIWMALYILISSIIPVLWYLLLNPELGLSDLFLEIPTIVVIAIFAWVMRRVLI